MISKHILSVYSKCGKYILSMNSKCGKYILSVYSKCEGQNKKMKDGKQVYFI